MHYKSFNHFCFVWAKGDSVRFASPHFFLFCSPPPVKVTLKKKKKLLHCSMQTAFVPENYFVILFLFYIHHAPSLSNGVIRAWKKKGDGGKWGEVHSGVLYRKEADRRDTHSETFTSVPCKLFFLFFLYFIFLQKMNK